MTDKHRDLTLERQTAEVLAYTFVNGGGTFRLEGNTVSIPTSGYVVGIHDGDYASIPTDGVYYGTLLRQVQACIEYIRRDYPLADIGTWLEPDGILTIDPVQVFDSRAAAKDVATTYNQRAIYHLDTGETIYIRT